MRLHILGMNGPYPAPGKACSAYLLENGTTRIQLDLGTGSLAALTALTAPEDLTALVFSHWHFDHTSDALPLLYRLADAAAAGHAPLPVYGPADDHSPVRAALAASPAVALHTIAPGDLLTIGEAQLRVFAARHPVPAVMLRLTLDGKVLAFTGDTNTTPDLPALAEQADLLLADGLFTVDTWAEGKPHLSAKLAAELAAASGARQLIVTHLNPNLPAPVLLSEARSAFIGARLAECGAVYEL